jgi:peptidoglycan hydrolase-like amidase
MRPRIVELALISVLGILLPGVVMYMSLNGTQKNETTKVTNFVLSETGDEMIEEPVIELLHQDGNVEKITLDDYIIGVVMAEMPADVRVKWDLASNEVKESIQRRAKLYNFMNEGAIERFWNAIDFNEIKPIQNVYEGLETIQDERERAIRARIRSGRFGKMGY